jgi:hypothetical protein
VSDWTNLVSALAGASVTFAVTVYGQRQARKDARQARLDAIDDERRGDRDRRARDAIEAILGGFEDAFPLRRPLIETAADDDRVDDLARILYHQAVYIPDAPIRALIEEAARFLDYRERLGEAGVPLREIILQDRIMLHEVLGSWLRGEPAPELAPRYLAIRTAFSSLPPYRP